MAWWLVPALVKLRQQINAEWPNRDKTSDGSIGDTRHSSLLSDHNPDPDGSVDAIDIDVDGINVSRVLSALMVDQRTSYIIYNYRIWNHQNGWRAYTGKNPHTKHIHVSVRDVYQGQAQAWNLSSKNPVTPPPIVVADEEEDNMLLIRNIQTNGVVLIIGEEVVNVLGPTAELPNHNDYASFQTAIKAVGVSNAQFNLVLSTLNAPDEVIVKAQNPVA